MKEKLNLIKNILIKIAFILLIIICIFIMYYIISVKVYRNTGYIHKPYVSLQTVISESMLPNLEVYDVVFERLVEDKDIKVGDIITYVDYNNKAITITHRVVEVYYKDDSYTYKTKGDNNSECDNYLVSYDQVLGKVLFKIPQIGRMQFI